MRVDAYLNALSELARHAVMDALAREWVLQRYARDFDHTYSEAGSGAFVVLLPDDMGEAVVDIAVRKR